LYSNQIESLRWYPPAALSKYPHLNVQDSLLFAKFLEKYRDRYMRFCYDVPLIDESQTELQHGDALSHDWRYLTAFKIDCIGDTGFGLEIIEIKPSLSLQAIGQVTSYNILFRQYYQYFGLMTSRIVCLTASNDLALVCERATISLSVL